MKYSDSFKMFFRFRVINMSIWTFILLRADRTSDELGQAPGVCVCDQQLFA